jgi:hypothetical protein
MRKDSQGLTDAAILAEEGADLPKETHAGEVTKRMDAALQDGL